MVQQGVMPTTGHKQMGKGVKLGAALGLTAPHALPQRLLCAPSNERHRLHAALHNSERYPHDWSHHTSLRAREAEDAHTMVHEPIKLVAQHSLQ
jgi:hypothetical protein